MSTALPATRASRAASASPGRTARARDGLAVVDGAALRATSVGKGAFAGPNSALVARLRIGDGAHIGSGSSITKDVAPDPLALERSLRGRKLISDRVHHRRIDWAGANRIGGDAMLFEDAEFDRERFGEPDDTVL